MQHILCRLTLLIYASDFLLFDPCHCGRSGRGHTQLTYDFPNLFVNEWSLNTVLHRSAVSVCYTLLAGIK